MENNFKTPFDNYSFSLVTRQDQFLNLKQDWDRLTEYSHSYVPFLCHEWYQLWIQHFLASYKMLIVLLYHQNNLFCIAPFYITNQTFYGLRTTKVELLGNVYSPIRTFLFATRNEVLRTFCTAEIYKYIFNQHKRVDFIDLQSVPENEGDAGVFLKAATHSAYKHSCYGTFDNYYEDRITSTAHQYSKSLSKNLRKNIRKRERLLNETGTLQFKVITDFKGIDRYIDWYYEVYSKSWKKVEKVGPSFHADLARSTSKNGLLRLAFLTLNNEPIAAKFVIVHNGIAYFLKSAYDLNFVRFGPGSILTYKMLNYLIDSDSIREIDYGKGSESFKSQWVSKVRRRVHLRIYNRSIKGQILSILNDKLLPGLRKNSTLRKFKTCIYDRIFKQRADDS